MALGSTTRSVGADPAPRIAPLGDSALLVVFGEVVEPELSQRARALARAVEGERARGTSGWGAPVAAYASVLVPFDPLAWPLQVATTRLAELVERMDALKPADDDVAEPIVIDVRYGGEDGPDLEEVARRTGLAPAEVIGIHCGALYRVYFLGFAPGFGYLGPLPERLRLPRRDSPRVRVPAGSVAIAGAQTAIYPLETPGGWHLIGRTDAFMWEADRDPPALLQAGRSVRFRAVGGLIGGVVTRR